MDILLLNTDLETIKVVDSYNSLIWTDRFDESGNFELHIQIGDSLLEYMEKDFYLYNPQSDRLMIVETLTIESDTEEGAKYVITGRSLESILDRRIIWKQTVFKAVLGEDGKTYIKPNLQECIYQLFKDNILEPEIAARKVSNLEFEWSTDPKITSLEHEGTYYGEDLYLIVTTICRNNNIGFKITFDGVDKFIFKLYAGVDRSYEQIENPYVIFSPNYDNLLNSNYLDSDQSMKNVTLISGEDDKTVTDEDPDDEIVPKVTRIVELKGDNSGMKRREIFTDASSITSETDDGEKLSLEQYYAKLREQGYITLMTNATIKAFEGQVDPNRTYKYGEDYYIGDIVQVANEYGHEGTAYISEFVWSYSDSGVSAYPTFKAIQKGIFEE